MQISMRITKSLRRIIATQWTVHRSSLRVTRNNRFAAFTLCFAVLAFCVPANAQTAGSGSIQGVVTDSTGAVIPNAEVTLVEASTHVTLKSKTSSGGAYAFPNINVGTYSVTAVAQCFQTYSTTGNVLEVGSSIAINAKMTVGKTDVVVEVHS